MNMSGVLLAMECLVLMHTYVYPRVFSPSSFLSRQGLLSEGTSQRNTKFSDELTDEQRLIEEKR